MNVSSCRQNKLLFLVSLVVNLFMIVILIPSSVISNGDISQSNKEVVELNVKNRYHSRNISLPDFVYNLYHQMSESCAVSEVKIVSATGFIRYPRSTTFQLQIPRIEKNVLVQNVELYIQPPGFCCLKPCSIEIFRYNKITEASNHFYHRIFTEDFNTDCEVSINFTPVIDELIHQGQNKILLSVAYEDEHFPQAKMKSFNKHTTEHLLKVYLISHYIAKSNLFTPHSFFRMKRDLKDRIPKKLMFLRKSSFHGHHLCKKVSLYVDFREIGWDSWIIAPSGYWAHNCQGKCTFPISEHLNGTNHAIIQSLLHSVSPNIQPACCVPTKLKPITLLFLDKYGSVVLRQYEEMVVEECGCQ